MKIENAIFLDIDGVLATDRGQNTKRKFWFDEQAYPFNEKCVKVLNKTLKNTLQIMAKFAEEKQVKHRIFGNGKIHLRV